VQATPVADRALALAFAKLSQHGIIIVPTGADASPGAALLLRNVAGTDVGSITTTAAATQFNTTSDSRLKTGVDDLTGELALIQALRPVSFRWRATDAPGVGFLAHEVAAHVQGVITGDEGAVDEDGQIRAQQIDLSKLVPYLVGAIKTMAARLAVLEDALGA
jgi:hypothetical protein